MNRERKVIQNPLAPERGAAPEALPQAPAPTEVAHPAVRALYGNDLNEIESSVAKAIMSYDLEISAETDTEIPANG